METLKFSLTTPHFQNHLWDYHSSRILGVYNKKGLTFSFSLTCKLKTSKGKKINKRKIAPGIIFLPDSSAAPRLLERKKVAESTARNSGCWPEMELGVLSYLSLAIGEMFAVSVLMALGTIIDQGEVPELFFQNFPEYHPVFSFFSWKWISTLSLDHMCSSPIVLGTLALLGASLMARTYTTQIPLVNVARRRYFSNSAETIRKQEDADAPPRASVKDSGVTLQGAGYEVYLKGPSLHAFKGLAGRFASIGVHLALLLVMSGGSLDTAGSLGGDVTVPQGLNSVVGDVLAPSGVHVNRCYMDYDEFGEVPQFHTDISLLDLNGNEVLMKTISVDDPLIRRPNLKLPIEIDGTKLTHPGAPIVYASLGSLMLSTCISYLSQSQLSALQDGKTVVVDGKTDRATSKSSHTGNSSLNQVPELLESSSTEESDSFIGFRIQVGIWIKKDVDM